MGRRAWWGVLTVSNEVAVMGAGLTFPKLGRLTFLLPIR